MPLGPWNPIDFEPAPVSTEVANALAELGFDPEDPGVLDAGNLVSVRGLLTAGYAKLKMQRRGASDENAAVHSTEAIFSRFLRPGLTFLAFSERVA